MAKGRRKNSSNDGAAATKFNPKRQDRPLGKDMKKRDKQHAKKLKKKAPMKDVNTTPAAGDASASASALVVPAPAPANKTNGRASAIQGSNKEKVNRERFSGFIFMCNGKTKPECYQYRVFGLPSGKKDVVEKIKAGTKLFLFDTDLRILYGIYKASSNGSMSLEPAAFGGKFPAQVKFQILKDCLPLPESAYKQAIKENYDGRTKFNPELNNRQVKDLFSLFRPIAAQPSAPVAPPPKMPPPRALPPPVKEAPFRRPTARLRLPPPEDPYTAGVHFGRAPPAALEPRPYPSRLPHEDPYAAAGLHLGRALPIPESRHVPPIAQPTPQDWYGSSQHVAPAQVVDPRHVQPVHPPPRSDPLYPTDTHQNYFPENPSQPAQDPYSRYRIPPPEDSRDRLARLESEYRQALLERERETASRVDATVDYYSRYPGVAATTQPPPASNYAPPLMHPPLELPSSFSQQGAAAYRGKATYEDQNHPYAEPISARTGLAGSVPVSSLYSFAGAMPTYR